MRLGTCMDGTPLDYEGATGRFTIGEAPVSFAQVTEHDSAGRITWLTEDLRAWAMGVIALDGAAAVTPAPAVQTPAERRRRLVLAGSALLAGLAVVVAVWALASSLGSRGPAGTSPSGNTSSLSSRTPVTVPSSAGVAPATEGSGTQRPGGTATAAPTAEGTSPSAGETTTPPARPPAAVRFGLTVAQRRAVAWEVAAKELEARAQADARYPSDSSVVDSKTRSENLRKATAYYDTLDERYKAATCKKYHITRAQMLDIMVEAFQGGWPSPASS